MAVGWLSIRGTDTRCSACVHAAAVQAGSDRSSGFTACWEGPAAAALHMVCRTSCRLRIMPMLCCLN